MLNYMKSEWYRLTHTKDLWMDTAIASGLILAMNVVLSVSRRLPDFRYGTARFSLSFLIGGLMVLCYAGLVWALFLFGGQRKNGIMKNAVAYGISRTQLFIGNCLVCGAAALVSLAVITAVWVGSAAVLLDGPVRPYGGIMLLGIAAQLPFAVACVIFYLGLQQYFEKEGTALVIWIAVICVIPKVLQLAGLKIPALARIAGWMPAAYLSTEVYMNMSGYDCLWLNGAGLAKCLTAGFVGIAVFSAVGIWLNRRADV